MGRVRQEDCQQGRRLGRATGDCRQLFRWMDKKSRLPAAGSGWREPPSYPGAAVVAKAGAPEIRGGSTGDHLKADRSDQEPEEPDRTAGRSRDGPGQEAMGQQRPSPGFMPRHPRHRERRLRGRPSERNVPARWRPPDRDGGGGPRAAASSTGSPEPERGRPYRNLKRVLPEPDHGT